MLGEGVVICLKCIHSYPAMIDVGLKLGLYLYVHLLPGFLCVNEK